VPNYTTRQAFFGISPTAATTEIFSSNSREIENDGSIGFFRQKKGMGW
jgi:hypothetical protein